MDKRFASFDGTDCIRAMFKKLLQRPIVKYTLMATAIVAVALLPKLWHESFLDKPSVTLSDGTVITVEEIEIFSTWTDRLCSFLSDKWGMREFLYITLNWKRDMALSKTDFAMRLKLSTNDTSQFTRIDENPIAWLTAKDSRISFLGIAAIDEQMNLEEDVQIGHFDTKGQQKVIIQLHSPKVNWVHFDAHRLNGKREGVFIPLKKGFPAEPPPEFMEKQGRPIFAKAQPLPAVQGIRGIAADFRLESAPVEFGEHNGVKVLKDGVDITDTISLSRHISPWFLSDVRLFNAKLWNEIPSASVFFRGHGKISKDLPPQKRLTFPPLKIDTTVPFHFVSSKMLNPDLPECKAYFLNPGVYVFSGNSDKEQAMELTFFAKAKQEKATELENILKSVNQLIRFYHFEDEDGDLIWHTSNKDYTHILLVELSKPSVFVTFPIGKTYENTDEENWWAECFQNSKRCAGSDLVSLWGCQFLTLKDFVPDADLHVTIGKTISFRSSLFVRLDGTDAKAWGEQLLKQKAEKEKTKEAENKKK